MTAKPTIMRTAVEETLATRAEEASRTAGPLQDLRRQAAAAFAESGLPHRRVEAYKYTDLKALMRAAPPIAGSPDADAAKAALGAAPGWGEAKVCRIVFVDGHHVAALSDPLPAGVSVASLAEALGAGHPLLARIGTVARPAKDVAINLNTAFMQDGALIAIAEGARVETPLEIIHCVSAAEPVACYPRHVVVAEKGARARIIETYAGPAGTAYQVDAAVELVVGDGADIAWVKRQEEGAEALHLSSLAVSLAANAKFDFTGVMLGGAIARSQVFLAFTGEAASADLRGVTLARGRQHSDTTLVIDHAVPACTSTEVFKSALDDEAKGIFQGQIIVRPDAQKTDGRMMARALLLSEDCDAISKPELEIYADDVQCAHGSTSGEIDEDALFYLMARGIPRDLAKTMLVSAYLAEVIEAIGDEALADALKDRAESWLAARQEPAKGEAA